MVREMTVVFNDKSAKISLYTDVDKEQVTVEIDGGDHVVHTILLDGSRQVETLINLLDESLGDFWDEDDVEEDEEYSDEDDEDA